MQKLLTFFSAKILAYMPYLMIKVLTMLSLVLNNWAQIGSVKYLRGSIYLVDFFAIFSLPVQKHR